MPTQYKLYKWDGHNEDTMELEEASFNKGRITNAKSRNQRIYPKNKYRIIAKRFKK